MISELRNKMITETVYLLNTYEKIVLRREPGPNGNFFARFTGVPEYPIKKSSEIVVEALFEGKELTREEYENY